MDSQILNHRVPIRLSNPVLFHCTPHSVYSVHTVFVVTAVVPLRAKLFLYFCAWLLPLVGFWFLIPSTSLFSTLTLIFSFIIAFMTSYNYIIDCVLICFVSYSLPINFQWTMRPKTKCVLTIVGCYGLDYAWYTAGTQ